MAAKRGMTMHTEYSSTEPLEIQRIRKCKALADTLLELNRNGKQEGAEYQSAWERLFSIMSTDERSSMIGDAIKSGEIPASLFFDYPGEAEFYRRIAEIMRLPPHLIHNTFAAIETAPTSLH